jgi:ubiquitin-like 1-activating enzyme E1 B
MAGNIIPAIATTNAIIAGLIVMQALNLLSNKISSAKTTYLKSTPDVPIGFAHPEKPNTNCSICRDVYIPFKVDLKRCTLGEFVKDIVHDWLVKGRPGEDAEEDLEVQVYEGGRLLADPDFEDNHERTLENLGVERGKILTVRDEDGKYRAIQFCVTEP